MSAFLARVCLVAAFLLPAEGIRHRRMDQTKVGSKTLVGVPIHNYDLRFLQTEEQAVASDTANDLELNWVLSLNGEWTQGKLDQLCAQFSCKGVGHPQQGGLRFATIRATETGLTDLLAAHGGDVAFVEPDLPVFLIPEIEEADVESGGWDSVWGHETINLGSATHKGKGVHIYVMDSGIRATHNDFGGRAVQMVDTLMGDGELVECDGSDPDCARDRHGHGTHVAGTAAGGFYGVAKEANVYGMRVCCGTGTNIYAGMDWIMMKGNRPAVMTMSLGSEGQSQSSREAVDAMVAAGITVTVSAGNNNINACEKTYAFIPSAIAVGATTIKSERGSYSNYGTCVAIYAPGSGVLSTGHWKDDVQRKMTGTSMATPFVAGAAALLLEEFPELSPAGVRSEMLRRATAGVIANLKDGDPNLLLSVV